MCQTIIFEKIDLGTLQILECQNQVRIGIEEVRKSLPLFSWTLLKW